jgi:signal transduction histidine kinase
MATFLKKSEDDVFAQANTAEKDSLPNRCLGTGGSGLPGYCLRVRPAFRRLLYRRRLAGLVAPILTVAATTALFLGLDILENQYFSDVSAAARHALVTAGSVLVALVVYVLVHRAVSRQQRRLCSTADQLAELLKHYRVNAPHPVRFENPHMRRCYEVTGCDHTSCPMREMVGQRCWQVMGLCRANAAHRAPRVEIDKCLACEVYRASCPDKFIELGESFNNLLFLLSQEVEKAARMRAQMIEQEKMAEIGQIAAGIAHEVGNPLSSISSVVQMLKRGGAEGAMIEKLNLIETHIGRISTTVRRVVNLARPLPDHWEPVDVAEAIDEVVQLLAFDHRAKNVNISLDVPQAHPRTYAIRGQLQQVFINLMLNALDAMPNGGDLAISARHENGSITVRVRDTGCGIPEECRTQLFDPFFTTKEPGRGTGLGLAVSREIVSKHHGTIDYRSTVGSGTEFILQIPFLDKSPDT